MSREKTDPIRRAGKATKKKKRPGRRRVLKAGRNCSFLPATGGGPPGGARVPRGGRRGARGGSGTTKPRDARRWRATRSRTPRSRVRAGRPAPLPRRAHARGRAHLDDAELVEARPEIRIEDVLHRLRARPRRDGIVRQRHHGRRDAGSRGKRARVEQCAPSGSRREALRFLGRKYPEFPAPGAEAEISLEPCHVVEGERIPSSPRASTPASPRPCPRLCAAPRLSAFEPRSDPPPSPPPSPGAPPPRSLPRSEVRVSHRPPRRAEMSRESTDRAPSPPPRVDVRSLTTRPPAPPPPPPPPSLRSRAQPTAGSRTNPTTTSSRCVPPPRDASGLRRFVR